MATIYCRNCKKTTTSQPPKSTSVTSVNYCKHCKEQSPFFRRKIDPLERVTTRLKAARDDRSVTLKLEVMLKKYADK